MSISAIYARASNGAFGLKGALPWGSFKEDLARFKALTLGHTILMGRRTWESLPAKPLSGRVSVVLATGSMGIHYPADMKGYGIQVLQERAHPLSGDVWLIGGAGMIASALKDPDCTRVELTQIHREYEADVFVPAPSDVPGWVEVKRTDHVSATGVPFSFISYERAR